MTDLRSLPSVDQLLQTEEVNQWSTSYGRPLTLDAIRSVLDKVRLGYAEASTIPDR